jgi:hypothetical protein
LVVDLVGGSGGLGAGGGCGGDGACLNHPEALRSLTDIFHST